MLKFIKLGGSLITDKRIEKSFRADVMNRLGDEIAQVLDSDSSLRLAIGHGSGSFGHFAAKRFNTIAGVYNKESWNAFAEVSRVAAELNFLICDSLAKSGVPAMRIQPSASLLSRSGEVISMLTSPIELALQQQLVPVVYGDVSFDEVLGGTIISTEKLFFYLIRSFDVSEVILLGEVPGVYDSKGYVFPEINSSNLSYIESALGGSGGVDVTGGMETKVRDMMKVAHDFPNMNIRIMTGLEPDLLRQTLLGLQSPGTRIAF